MEMTELNDAALPVMFRGEKYVWLKNDDGSGALAYPDHIDPDGHVRLDSVFSDSFAHVFGDGRILRYGAVIGTRDDLVFDFAS